MKERLTDCPARDDAIKLGQRFFMPPGPCRNGHISARYVVGSVCVECSKVRNSSSRSLVAADLERSIQSVVYVISIEGFIKVGIAEDVQARLQVLSTHCPFEARLSYCTSQMPRPEARRIEIRCGFALATYSVRGEWYRCDAEKAIAVIKEAQAEIGNSVIEERPAEQLNLAQL